MRRFFIPTSNIDGQSAVITGSDVHHILHVLRKKEGDTIEATDGTGNRITARIESTADDKIQLSIVESIAVPERKTRLKLYQAMPRGGKFDWIIEKACELGVDELVPVISERTVTRLSEERGLKKIARWERLVLETMKQVGRLEPMKLSRAIPLEEIGSNLSAFSLKLIPWELEDSTSLKQALDQNTDKNEIEIVIGPEGGFSAAEVERLTGYGFLPVTLGKRILKAETAAISAIASIYFQRED